MPLSNAERVAAWRQRQRTDPERYNEYKRKERERYQKKKQKGVVKSVSELGTRDKRIQRRAWRKNQQSKRSRDREMKRKMDAIVTPPMSPTTSEQDNPPNRRAESMRRIGKRKVRRDRAKSHRELFKLRIQLRNERKLKERYKKRCQRFKKHGKKNKLEKEVDAIIQRHEHKKALLVNQAIVNRIRSRYIKSKSQDEKRMISSIVCSYKILRKLKLAQYAKKKLGFSSHSFNINRDGRSKPRRKVPGKCKEEVVAYLSRDDNSRVKAGKKSTITRHGEKRQIRLLSDDLKNLHAKFVMEKAGKLSYSLFCSLRPFHIKKPTAKDRDTCQCKIHENLRFKLEKCQQLKVLVSGNIDDVLSSITCDINNKACMYRECRKCENKEINIDLTEGHKQVSWKTWKSKREERERKLNGETTLVKVNITVKDREYGTLQTLSEELSKDIIRASRHIFNIRNQYKALQHLKRELTHEELVIQIDFSENYNCKYSEEIQSMHFGASQRQISLHTGVAYSSSRTYSFCTLSDNLKHSPAFIWAHLHPVILHLKASEMDATIVHFISDGPTTQYRSKLNFYLFATKIFEYGFKEGTWNFLEAGHGKGAADGIGAVIKRTADSLVNVQGKDITNATELEAELNKVDSSVKVFLISDDSIDSLEAKLPTNLKPLPKTMQIHQLLTDNPGEVHHRVLSCFCRKPHKCDCFGLNKATFPVKVYYRGCPVTYFVRVTTTYYDSATELGSQSVINHCH